MIRTCLFDMGNVLVFFSHDRMCEQLGGLCGRSVDEMRRLLFDSGTQWEYERGRISPVEFHAWFQQVTGREVNFEDLYRAGADIFSLNQAIIGLLDRLKQVGLRLVLLSNTCQSHFDWVWEQYDVLQRFDAHVASYRVGALKPDDAIFTAAIGEIGCSPEECLYTDDIPDYVAAGRRHGLQAEVFTDVPSLINQLQRVGVSV